MFFSKFVPRIFEEIHPFRRFRCGGPWYRHPGGDGRGELLRSVASSNVYPSCGAHGTRREGPVIQFPCPNSWVLSGWRLTFCTWKGPTFFAAKHLNFSFVVSIFRFHCAWLFLWVVCFSKIQRMSMSQLLHMHHFCYHWAGGAYIYLRDTWWFGPFWEDASWERWLLGAYQTLRQSIQESDLESLGSRINLRHCHHLFLKKPLQKLRKISDPQRGTKSKEVLVDTSLESFGSVALVRTTIFRGMKEFQHENLFSFVFFWWMI